MLKVSIVTEDSTMCHTFKFGAPVNPAMTALCNSRAGDRDSHGDDDNCSLCGGNDGANVYRVFELKVDTKYCSPIPTITKLYGTVLASILSPPSIVIVT